MEFDLNQLKEIVNSTHPPTPNQQKVQILEDEQKQSEMCIHSSHTVGSLQPHVDSWIQNFVLAVEY